MNIPRIVIAGTNSGCGKTTLTAGILAALIKRGQLVQPFKVGPDYIDPMFHTFITGVPSRNLDSWMLSQKTVGYLFEKNSAGKDISVIEGVMGLYDGFGGTSAEAGTAEISKMIKAPVILVVNGEGMSLSIAALVKGFIDFDPEVNIQGVIINNIKSENHYHLLKEVIEEHTGITALGYLLKMPECSFQSRHLGLVPSEEIQDLKQKIEALSEQVEKTIHLDKLISIAEEAGAYESEYVKFPEIQCVYEKIRIAVARDKAFNFYYQDNFDLLEAMGAELVLFRPTDDPQLPDGIHGLYIGGGYPEIWAGALEQNLSMKASIKRSITAGLPTYAECGGLMYLTRSIRNAEGKTFAMVGVIQAESEMTNSLKRFGYVEIEVADDTVLSPCGGKIRGHEFHYSVTNAQEGILQSYRVNKTRKGKVPVSWKCGYTQGNLLAGYPHLHFWSNTEFAWEFVKRCKEYKHAKDEKEGYYHES